MATSTPQSSSPEAETPRTPRNHSASLRRALMLVDLLAEASESSSGLQLVDLARRAGLTKSTVLRLLAPLAEYGLARQDPRTKEWRLGPHVAYLGQVYLDAVDLRRIAHPTLSDLVGSTGETAHLATFDAPYIVYLDKVDSPSPLRTVTRIGGRQPAHSTGLGKAYLGWASEEEVQAVLANGLVQRTPNTLTTESALREAIATIRRHGHSVDDMENEIEIRCVGAPVFDVTGAVCASISVAGPTSRVTKRRVPQLAVEVKAAADTITRALGGVVNRVQPGRDVNDAAR